MRTFLVLLHNGHILNCIFWNKKEKLIVSFDQLKSAKPCLSKRWQIYWACRIMWLWWLVISKWHSIRGRDLLMSTDLPYLKCGQQSVQAYNEVLNPWIIGFIICKLILKATKSANKLNILMRARLDMLAKKKTFMY